MTFDEVLAQVQVLLQQEIQVLTPEEFVARREAAQRS
jgi:hypothetical protein